MGDNLPKTEAISFISNITLLEEDAGSRRRRVRMATAGSRHGDATLPVLMCCRNVKRAWLLVNKSLTYLLKLPFSFTPL